MASHCALNKPQFLIIAKKVSVMGLLLLSVFRLLLTYSSPNKYCVSLPLYCHSPFFFPEHAPPSFLSWFVPLAKYVPYHSIWYGFITSIPPTPVYHITLFFYLSQYWSILEIVTLVFLSIHLFCSLLEHKFQEERHLVYFFSYSISTAPRIEHILLDI